MDDHSVVHHIFCSAQSFKGKPELDIESSESLARIILDAMYEATVYAARHIYETTGNNKLFLSLVGVGVFKNKNEWIISAIHRAIGIAQTKQFGLDIYIIDYLGTTYDVLYPIIWDTPEHTYYNMYRNNGMLLPNTIYALSKYNSVSSYGILSQCIFWTIKRKKNDKLDFAEIKKLFKNYGIPACIRGIVIGKDGKETKEPKTVSLRGMDDRTEDFNIFKNLVYDALTAIDIDPLTTTLSSKFIQDIRNYIKHNILAVPVHILKPLDELIVRPQIIYGSIDGKQQTKNPNPWSWS